MAIIFTMVITSRTVVTTLYRFLACYSKKLQRNKEIAYFLANISLKNLSDKYFTTYYCQGMR
jgi:hypothetical protein